jgi:hypothetical protein
LITGAGDFETKPKCSISTPQTHDMVANDHTDARSGSVR